jgi:hypothetical protein
MCIDPKILKLFRVDGTRLELLGRRTRLFFKIPFTNKINFLTKPDVHNFVDARRAQCLHRT